MATNNSTGCTAEGATADFFQKASDYFCGMQAFWDLAEREIQENNNTDFDNMAFLLKAAKAETFRISSLLCEIQEKSEVHHA